MRGLIVDANILVGALLGRSLPLILETSSRAVLMVPVPQWIETRKVTISRLGEAVGPRLDDLLDIVQLIDLGAFAHLESEARRRLDIGGQSDWPVLAAALLLDACVWSRDVDLFGTGIAVWSTRNILRFPSEATTDAN